MERRIVPNCTPFPNFLTDEMLSLTSGDEWKVIHFGAVACLRLDGGDDGVSIAQFAQGTGLSEEAVRQCLTFLCDTAQIFLRQDRPRKPQAYKLNREIGEAQVEILERRRKDLARGSEPEGGEADEEPVTVQPPEAASNAGQRDPGDRPKPPVEAEDASRAVKTPLNAAAYPQRPSVDIRLDGSGEPVANRLRQTLAPPERAAFELLLRMYPAAAQAGEDSEAWGLYRLWQTYGFVRVTDVLQKAEAGADLGDINRACLLGEISSMYEREIGRLTPASEAELTRLADAFPTLSAWQDALRIAVTLNKRRLSTVETILKNQMQKDMDASHRAEAYGATGAARVASRGRRRLPAYESLEIEDPATAGAGSD
jgi:DnaD/phage-associated family protein